eukprot:12931949-Heterocapsa_arctica.AAC.1
MVLVVVVPKVPKSVDVMVVVGGSPSGSQFDNFVLVKGFGYGILQGRGMRGNGVFVIVVVSILVLLSGVVSRRGQYSFIDQSNLFQLFEEGPGSRSG